MLKFLDIAQNDAQIVAQKFLAAQTGAQNEPENEHLYL